VELVDFYFIGQGQHQSLAGGDFKLANVLNG